MKERVEKTFAVNGSLQLKVSNVRGSITVRGEERGDVQVLAVNAEVAEEPSSIRPETWLVQLLPVNLEAELSMLLRG